MKKNRQNLIKDARNIDEYQPNKKYSQQELNKQFKKKKRILIGASVLTLLSIIICVLTIVYFRN